MGKLAQIICVMLDCSGPISIEKLKALVKVYAVEYKHMTGESIDTNNLDAVIDEMIQYRILKKTVGMTSEGDVETRLSTNLRPNLNLSFDELGLIKHVVKRFTNRPVSEILHYATTFDVMFLEV